MIKTTTHSRSGNDLAREIWSAATAPETTSMSEVGDGSNAASKALDTLKDMPLWLFIGLAMAANFLLFAPIANAELPDEFRPWLFVGGVLFNFLAVARLADLLVESLGRWRQARIKSPKFHLSIDSAESRWSTSRQSDDSTATQLVVRGLIKNLTDTPLGFVEPRLIKPKMRGEVIRASVMTSGTHGYSSTLDSGRRVPPNGLVAASIDFSIRGAPACDSGSDLPTVIGLIDDEGTERRVRGVLKGIRPTRVGEPQTPLEQAFSIADPVEKEIVSVLQAEIGRYDKHGRERGAFGSLHILFAGKIISGFGQDSWNPNSPENQSVTATPGQAEIRSDNLGALLNLFARLTTEDDKSNFANALLGRLNKDSGYLRISYFIVCALWKSGRLEEALQQARTLPKNDRTARGLSNVLLMLNGFLRYRHPDFTPEMLDQIEGFVHDLGDEHTFQILEKVAAIRAIRLADT